MKIVALGAEVRKLNAEGSQKDLLIEKVLKEAEEDCALMDEVIKEILRKASRFTRNIKRLWLSSVLSWLISRKTTREGHLAF